MTSLSPIPRRKLGSTGEELSVIGFGGILVVGQSQDVADRQVRAALDDGLNYFDVAPTYEDGEAEEKLGAALRGHRDGAFLACKTTCRDRAGATDELHRSLMRLQTDRFDLYQLHGLPNLAEAEQALSPGGAIEALVEARDKGLVRHLGFSAHSVKAALYCIESFDFDSVLFPVNFACFTKGGFGPQVLEAAERKNMGVLALKALAKQLWPEGAERNSPKCWYEPLREPEHIELALRFTLSLPVTAAIPSGDESLFPLAVAAARNLRPILPEERERLLTEAEQLTPVFTCRAA